MASESSVIALWCTGASMGFWIFLVVLMSRAALWLFFFGATLASARCIAAFTALFAPAAVASWRCCLANAASLLFASRAEAFDVRSWALSFAFTNCQSMAAFLNFWASFMIWALSDFNRLSFDFASFCALLISSCAFSVVAFVDSAAAPLASARA